MGLFNCFKHKNKNIQEEQKKENPTDKNVKKFFQKEAMHSLCTKITACLPKHSDGTGLVIIGTSSYAQEGKTTINTNLAINLSCNDKKVVLLGADLRKGKMNSKLGVTDYLTGKANLDQIILSSKKTPNTFIIPHGTYTPKPYELMESTAMKELIRTLKKQFAFIIIDTPPIQVVSDAFAIISESDGVYLVCRHRETYEQDIRRSLNSLKFFRANILGIVVNQFEINPHEKRHGSYNYLQKSLEYTENGTQTNKTSSDSAPTQCPNKSAK